MSVDVTTYRTSYTSDIDSRLTCWFPLMPCIFCTQNRSYENHKVCSLHKTSSHYGELFQQRSLYSNASNVRLQASTTCASFSRCLEQEGKDGKADHSNPILHIITCNGMNSVINCKICHMTSLLLILEVVQ